MKFVLVLLFLFSTETFAFSKEMFHYKVSFNQKRKVSELSDLIEKCDFSNETKLFYQAVVRQYSDNDLPMLEFSGPNIIFKYRNQKSVGKINLEKDLLLIGDHKISLGHYENSKELFSHIDKTLSEEEGDAFLMFLSSETREKAPLLNSKLQALFWAMSAQFAKSHEVVSKTVRRFIATEKSE